MAVPKRRVSKTRRDKRRANHFLTRTDGSRCAQCNELKRPHCVCPHCGTYRKRQVLQPKEAM